VNEDIFELHPLTKCLGVFPSQKFYQNSRNDQSAKNSKGLHQGV
jgi:hypothetical protein